MSKRLNSAQTKDDKHVSTHSANEYGCRRRLRSRQSGLAARSSLLPPERVFYFESRLCSFNSHRIVRGGKFDRGRRRGRARPNGGKSTERRRHSHLHSLSPRSLFRSLFLSRSATDRTIASATMTDPPQPLAAGQR